MVITTFITYAYKGEKAENNAQLKEHTENLDLVYSESSINRMEIAEIQLRLSKRELTITVSIQSIILSSLLLRH